MGKLNGDGFGITHAMMALAMLTIASMGLGSLANMMGRAARGHNATLEAAGLENILGKVTADASLCTPALENQSISGNLPLRVRSDFFEQGQLVPGRPFGQFWDVEKIYYDEVERQGTRSIGSLKVEIQKSSATGEVEGEENLRGHGAPYRTIDFPVILGLQGNRIESCEGTGGSGKYENPIPSYVNYDDDGDMAFRTSWVTSYRFGLEDSQPFDQWNVGRLSLVPDHAKNVFLYTICINTSLFAIGSEEPIRTIVPPTDSNPPTNIDVMGCMNLTTGWRKGYISVEINERKEFQYFLTRSDPAEPAAALFFIVGWSS